MQIVRKAVRSGQWNGLSTLTTSIAQYLQLIVFARVLSPADFGVAALLLTLIALIGVLSDFGVNRAIIQRPSISSMELSSLYWLNLSAAFFLALVISFASPIVAGLFRNTALGSYLPLASLCFPFNAVGQQFGTLLQKDLNFKPIAIVEMTASVIAALVSVSLVALGFGPLGVVIGALINSALKAGLLFTIGFSQWKPRFHFRYIEVKPFLAFGSLALAGETVASLNQRLDQLIIARVAGPAALGFYNLAFNLVCYPVSKINPIVTRVLFPLFTKLDNSIDLQTYYIAARRLLAIINFPLLAGIATTAPVFVPLIFGPQWSTTIPIIQILAAGSMLRAVANPVGALMLSQNKPTLNLKWNTFVLVAQAVSFPLAFYLGGLTGLAYAFVFLQALYFVLVYFVIVKPLVGRCAQQYVLSIASPAIASVLMAVLLWQSEPYLPSAPVFKLLLLVGIGAAFYLLIALVLFRGKASRLASETKRKILSSSSLGSHSEPHSSLTS